MFPLKLPILVLPRLTCFLEAKYDDVRNARSYTRPATGNFCFAVNVIRDISDFMPQGKVAVSIGNFDGIHAGHRQLLQRLKSVAADHRCPAVVVTFDPHPIEILCDGVIVPKLTTLERKADLLKSCGIDLLVVLITGHDLLSLDHETFFQQYVIEKLNAGAMVEGPNFFFGKDRTGTTEKLADLCRRSNIELSIVEINESDQGITSSSTIRKLIKEGRVEEANELLVDSYLVSGTVTEGAKRGREIGFPTANLEGIQVLVPGEGVYAGRVSLERDSVPAAIHIGPNPTFADEQQKVEVHLIDQKISLYDRTLHVEFLKRIRGIQKFNNTNELVSQIKSDLSDIKSYLCEEQN